jgi:hypothetical protein
MARAMSAWVKCAGFRLIFPSAYEKALQLRNGRFKISLS